MEFVLSVLAGICVALLFSLAIFIHEFGHFLAARLLGLQVDAFAIGFGPALFKRKVNGCEYKIGCVPFGGYVALPQLDPSGMEKVQGETHGGEDRVLPDVAAWKRIVVACAGPFGNVVLAVLLAYAIFWLPGVKTGVVETRVGMVAEDSDAWQAGLRPDDRIVTVNGVKVSTWTDLQVENQLAGESGEAVFGVQRGLSHHELRLSFETNNIFGLRVLAGVLPQDVCEVGGVIAGSSAEAQGVRDGDVIVALDGVPVTGTHHFSSLLSKYGASPATLKVKRGMAYLTVTVVPRYDEAEKRHLVGIRWKDAPGHVKAWMMYREPWQQLKWDSMSVVRVLKALVVPKSKGERKSVAKNVGGPIAIAMGLYDTVRGDFMDAIGFLRMICVNLAILNLLPLPVLDGGHILFALYEIITRRKPHPKVVAVLVNACAVLLIGLMALLVYGDIVKRVKLNKAIRSMTQDVAEETPATNVPPQPGPAQP